MTFLEPIGRHTVDDSSVSDLLAQWIAEQQQRTTCACASGHASAFWLHRAMCEMEAGPFIVGMRPPYMLSWKPGAFPAHSDTAPDRGLRPVAPAER